MPASRAVASLLFIQRIQGDGSERCYWWFWGVFAVLTILGAGYYLFKRWQMEGGD